MQPWLWAGTLAVALHGGAALAEGPDGEGTAPSDYWADRAHETITLGLDRTAAWFDGFFGDPRIEVSREASAYLIVILDSFTSGVPDEERVQLRVRGGANLPRFNDRLRLILSSDADATLTGRDLTGIEPDREERAEDTGGVGLGLLVRDERRHKFGIGGGLAGGLSPEVVINARYRYTHPLGTSARAQFTPTLYWRSDRGPGLSAVTDLQWSPDERNLWRYTLFGDYQEQDDELDWSTQLSWQRQLDARSAINPRLGARGEIEPEQVLREVWAGLRYRRQVGRPWFFVEVEPGLSWHERVDYQTEPTIALRLEVQFVRQR